MDQYRALLIEADEVDKRVLLRAMKHSSEAYRFDHVSCMELALKRLEKNSYDVIISDINLPDCDGLATVDALLRYAPSSPIILLSGTANEHLGRKAVQAGAQDFIPKAYANNTDMMSRSIRHAIERQQRKSATEASDDESVLAYYDECTGLPNRSLFYQRIDAAIEHAQQAKQSFSLFFIDLDRFKHVNDTFGHNAGDEVLRQVSARITRRLGPSDSLARFGGDEFVAIVNSIQSKPILKGIASEVICDVNESITIDEHCATVGASIGIATYPQDGDTPEQLLKHADMAMYEAKGAGRNQSSFFTYALLKRKQLQYSQERVLRSALESPDDYFCLHFQPKVDLKTLEVESVEALIRCKVNNRYDSLLPTDLIPLAEELNLINHIDQWVLNQACKHAKTWQYSAHPVRICINISTMTLSKPNIVKELFKPALEQHGVSGELIEIEITESLMLEDTQQVYDELAALRALGIRIAVDDFGKGFSSLNYLSKLPIDTLKIDGSFICDQQAVNGKQTLLKAIIAMGKALDLTVVAECIETEEQFRLISRLGAHQGQGFYWAKPTPNWSPRLEDYEVVLQND